MVALVFCRSGIATKCVTALNRTLQGFASLLLAVSASAAVADEAVPDLEIVRSSYIQAVSSIRTLDCRLTHTQINESPKAEVDVAGMPKSELHYARDESRQLLSTLGKDASGKATIRIWASFDGQVYSSWAESLMETAEDGYFSPWGRIEAKEADELSTIQTIDSFLGYRLAGGHSSLNRLILKPEARIVGWETAGGHRCVRLELPLHAPHIKRPEHLWQTFVWLDPGFNFLPRRIQLVSAQNPKLASDLLVEEFGEYPSVGDATPISLPKVAVWKGGRFVRRMVVETAAVNQTLSADLFRVSFPNGTFVKESYPGRPVRTYSVGGEEVRKELVAKSTQNRCQGRWLQRRPKRSLPRRVQCQLDSRLGFR